MKVQLTSPVEGKMPGETVDVPDGKARWLLAQGYARVDDDGSHLLDTSVEAANDPTLATNREEPGTPPEHLANGDDDKTWSEKVLANQEFKGNARLPKGKKIVPGDPSTNVAAAEGADEQPEASEVEETEDPLASEDISDDPAPEITAADSVPKGRKRS